LMPQEAESWTDNEPKFLSWKKYSTIKRLN
jgi:hypothetical protein